jgi:hypothetical protein
MSWIESRVLLIEQKVESLYRRVADLKATLDTVRQQLRSAYQQLPFGGGSSSSGDWYCLTPASGSWGATWSGSTPTSPGSFSATVYSVSGTTPSSLGTQTVYNWFPASPATSKVIKLTMDAGGNFTTGPQSCT